MARKGENITKRKDSRWEARFIKGHKDGKAVYGFVYGKTYMEAKERKREAMTRLKESEKKSPKVNMQPLMREIAEQWLNELSSTKRKSTIVKYNSQMENHILPFLGDIRINAISNADIIGFSKALLDVKNLSRKTAADILSRIKSIRKYAMIHGYDVQFISDCVSITPENKEIRVFTLEEENNLIGYLRQNIDQIGLGILICLFTGLRLGEICALLWSDISLADKEIHVSRTMQRLRNIDKDAEQKTYIHIGEPKSRSSIRTVPIPSIIWEELSSMYRDEGYVWAEIPKNFVEVRTFENRFKSILKNCGIENATVHTCRHTYATRCVEAGVDIKTLSEMLGHANISITLNQYVHPSKQFKHENVEKLSALFEVK